MVFPFHKDKIQSSEVQGGYRVLSDAVGHLHLCKLARNHKINDWTIECTEFSVCYHHITLQEYTYVSWRQVGQAGSCTKVRE